MQTDDLLILAYSDFANIKKDATRLAKIMTKNKEHFTLIYLVKFNGAQIKLNSNGIVLIKKSYIREILLIVDHIADSTYSIKITR